MSGPRVGVLALQGDTREHLAALREAGADSMPVRRRDELDAIDAGTVNPAPAEPPDFTPPAAPAAAE